MSVLRRAAPVVASLVAHGAVVAAVVALLVARSVLPALAGASGVEVGEDAEGDAESLDAYLARAADDVDFGEPTADLVAIGIITDEAPLVDVSPVVAAAAPVVAAEAPVVAAPVVAAEAPVVAAEAPVVAAEAPAPSAESVVAARPPRRHKQARSPLRAGRGDFVARDRDPDDGVLRVSRSSWAVERKVVDFYANNLGELMKLGWVRAHRDPDGKLRGFRVGVKKDSILRDAGFTSGDVVKSVNGIEVHDIFGALSAYFKLRKETHIEVVVTRKGRQMTLSYDLTS
ncbi:MAG: hypothetical protein EXR71_06600 [Myxococcales bacterium]|nr:hypothetical protein [Myxococcales bacterium]